MEKPTQGQGGRGATQLEQLERLLRVHHGSTSPSSEAEAGGSWEPGVGGQPRQHRKTLHYRVGEEGRRRREERQEKTEEEVQEEGGRGRGSERGSSGHQHGPVLLYIETQNPRKTRRTERQSKKD